MTFTIAQTKTTPFAEFKNGYLVIKGKSVPFDYPEFYDTIRDNLLVYSRKPEKKTFVDFSLLAINAISKKMIFNTFQFLEELNSKHTDITVHWHYQPDDEDVLELGQICQSKFKMSINLEAAV